MKKLFLCLMAICFLSACDKNSQPECWNAEIEKQIAENAFWTGENDIEYKAKQIIEIIEYPDVLKNETTKKYNRFCNATISFENGETHNFEYVPFWAISKKSKTARASLINSF